MSAFSKTSAIETSPASGSTVPTGFFKTFYQGPQSPGQNPNIKYPKNFRKKTVAPVVPVASPYPARVSAASHENFRRRLKSDVVVGLSEAPG